MKNENFIKKLLEWWKKQSINNIVVILIITIGTAIVIVAAGTATVYFVWGMLNNLQIDQTLNKFLSLDKYLNFFIVLLVSMSILMFLNIYRSAQKQIIKEKFILFRTSSLMIIAVMALLIVKLAPGVFKATNLGDIISLFALMLAFISGINYLLYELNKRDIDAKTKDIKEELQNYASAKAHFTTAFSLWVHYYCHCKNSINENQNTHIKLLNQAIIEARCSLNYANKLNPAIDIHEELVYKCKNNLAFFLAVKQDPKNKEEAYEHAIYIYNIAENKNKANDFKIAYTWKATWALVLWRFNEDKDSKIIAYNIINELIKDPVISQDTKKELKNLWVFINKKTKEDEEEEKTEDFDKIMISLITSKPPEK